jgi:hypothetical protein
MSAELRRTTTAVADIIRRLESDAPQEAAARVAMDAVDNVFNIEGPGWPKLAPRTRRERAARGYNPTYPIMTRSRQLRGSVRRTIAGGVVYIIIDHPNYPELAKGNPARRLPARPVRLGNLAQQDIADAITTALVGD